MVLHPRRPVGGNRNRHSRPGHTPVLALPRGGTAAPGSPERHGHPMLHGVESGRPLAGHGLVEQKRFAPGRASLGRGQRPSRQGLARDLRPLPRLQPGLDLPTNGGHPVKGVQSPWEVHHGKNATHLHPRVQGRGRQARHRARLLRRRGRTLPRPEREPHPLLESGPGDPGRPGLPRPRQAPSLRGGAAPPAGREPAAAGGARHPKKSYGALRPGGAVTFTFIDEHKGQWPVALLCDALGVSTAGYYAWRDRPASARQQRQDALLVEIRAIHAEVKARYGSPRVHAELAARGQGCCVNTVAKLMRDNDIRARTARKFRCTTDSNHDRPVAENVLDRQFDPGAPNEAWVADITYIPTREGWLYLAAVEDLYSRRVVGWSMAERLESRLVVDALAMAVQRRLPGAGLLAHSDRGSQYASEHYQRLLGQHGITCSMSRRADCWDNAPMESFFASLKKELVHGADFGTRAEARAAIFEYIEVFYNLKRRHSTLGYVAPAEYEQAE